MPRRIDIEITSALPDGSWTWRTAGAQKPKGTVDASILPDDVKVGDELKVEAEQMLDGMEIVSVVKGREKVEKANLLELLPDDKPFEAVIETKAKRGRGDGGGRGGDRDGRGRGRDGDRPRGRDGGGRDGDRPRGRDGGGRDGDRPRGRDGGGGRDTGRGERSDRPKKQHFEAPPEVPQRPKPKRLRPGKARTQEVLAAVPEEQRPIAELALQGMAAVRTRVKEENAKLKAADKPEMPEATITKMAEDMLPKLRVAEWLDRAEAAQRQMQHLDLRDLRSVVAASDDSIVARDESTRALAEELKASLATKQTEEMAHWLEDVDAALTVGRVIRALRLSSQPPKAGVMFPPVLAKRLGEAATASLLPDDSGDRWSAVLEAAAFSPVRALVTPTVAPTTIDDDLKKTALRLGPLLPQVAALLGVEVPKDAKRPKPLRPTSRKDQKKSRDGKRDNDRPRADGAGGGRGRDGASRDGASRDGGRNERGGRDGGRDSRGGRNERGSRGPKDRPKGMRDIATVMKAKEEAAKAAEEAAAAKAAEAEAEAATAAAAADEAAAASAESTDATPAVDAPQTADADESTDDAPADEAAAEPAATVADDAEPAATEQAADKS